MLILSYTDRFRIDLYQLRQWVLQSSCNRSRTSLSHIKVWKFLCCQFTCGIYGSACLICDHILYFFWNFFQKFHDNLLRFSGSCSISHRYQFNMILCDQFFQYFLCRLDLSLRSGRCRINNRSIQHLSCLVHYSQFASCTKSRVPAQYYFSYDRRLHQKLFQILAKYFDSPIFRFFCKITAYFPLNRRSDQTLVAVLHCRFQNWAGIRIFFFNHLTLQPF